MRRPTLPQFPVSGLQLLAIVWLCWCAPLAAQSSSEDLAPMPPPPPVDVERVASLETDIAADQKQLGKLRVDLETREAEYNAAVKEFNELKSALEAKQAEIEALKKKNNAEELAAGQEALEALTSRFELAKERVDLSIAERKAVQALITQLEKKISQDQLALDKMSGLAPAPEPAPPAATAEEKPAPAASLVPGLPAPAGATNGEAPKKSEPLSPRVAEAESLATQTAAEAVEARQTAQALDERKKTLLENIELERKRLTNSHKRHDNLSQTLLKLEEELFRELSAGKEYAALGDLPKQREAAQEQLQEVSQQINDHSERIQELQAQLLGLQQEQLAAAQEVEEKEAAAETARRNQWLVTLSDYAIVALPRVATIVLVLFVTYYLLRLIGRRLITLWSNTERGTEEERRNRAQTLVSVFENTATTAIYITGGLMVLETLKVPVGTLLGGVAVVGLAVAFGAQNLIRDYFSGFMILLEDQYKIHDVITINNMTGQVERITLRITVLRDFEGKVYFIPNGQITSVINLTHEWSRVVLDIPVAYKEKVEKVMGVLLEMGQKLASEPAFSGVVLREPELFGVERLSESAVLLRLCLVVRPSQKDTVRREMLRRIKGRFDELEIEIPLPQRMVHYRPLGNADGEPLHIEHGSNGASQIRPAIEEA